MVMAEHEHDGYLSLTLAMRNAFSTTSVLYREGTYRSHRLRTGP
jgi:hypothetical protein